MSRRVSTILLATLLAVGALAPHAGAAPAEVSATFTCASVEVTSSKDLSNVVLVFEDGSHQRFEDLSGHAGSFAGTGAHLGAVVVTAYVKSGNNTSGEGPGYGERFDSAALCGAPSFPDDVGVG